MAKPVKATRKPARKKVINYRLEAANVLLEIARNPAEHALARNNAAGELLRWAREGQLDFLD